MTGIGVLTEQIFKRRTVVRHKIVNNSSPTLNAGGVCLEETCLHHHLECFTLPCTTCILVAAQACQHL